MRPPLSKDEKILKELKFQNKLLIALLVAFCILIGVLILLGISMVVSLWLIYSDVDVISFNDAVREVRHLAQKSSADYTAFREALPRDLTTVTREALFSDDATEEENMKTLSKLMEHWANGLTGASSVLQQMDEVRFIHFATPLLTRLGEAAVTDAAAAGAAMFGEVVQYVGRHAKDKTLDSVFNTTKNMMEMTRDFILSNHTQKTINDMQKNGFIERFTNSSAAVMENLASVKFNGTEAGEDLHALVKNVGSFVQKMDESETFYEMRDSLYSLAGTLEVVAYDGVQIGGKKSTAPETRLLDKKRARTVL